MPDESVNNQESPQEPQAVQNDVTSENRQQVASASASQVVEDNSKPSPGLLVLQWLTYAFWGWTLLALGGLIFVTIATLLDTSNGYDAFGGGVAYLLAATIVLFLISLISDIFYARLEGKRASSTASNVIMIIHAVLFALFGIGALITAVFGLVQLAIGEGDGATGPLTAIIGGIIIALLYGATLLRTFRPKWLKGVVYAYWALMTATVVGISVLSIVGPVNQARLQAQDERAERGAENIAQRVNDTTKTSGRLPQSLNDIRGLNEDGQMLVDEKKVTYTPGERVSDTRSQDRLNSADSLEELQSIRLDLANEGAYTYKMCVEYVTSSNEDDSSVYDDYSRLGANVTPQTYSHKKGNVCYDLQTDYTN